MASFQGNPNDGGAPAGDAPPTGVASRDSDKRKKDEPPMEVMYTAKDLRFPTYVIIDGLYLPIDVDEMSLRFALNYRPSKGDIMVISYPKCGGVWVAYIAYMLLHEGAAPASPAALDQAMPNLEEYGYQMLRDPTAPDEVRVVRSHLPYHKMRINPMAKYIYITRNPKDCAVAMYHYIRHVGIFRFKEGTWDNFFEWFIRGRICYNDYFDHIIHYWVHRKDCHVLFLTYENMTLDHKSHIFMIANFIGGAAGTNVKNRHLLKKLLHRSSYAQMSQFFREESHLGHLGKGRIGEWKAVFSNAQATRLDRKFYERFGSSEIANLWRYIVRFDRPTT